MLDSGTGLPIGQKLHLKSRLQIDNPLGGKVMLNFKMRGFDPNEQFRISIDGETLLLENTDTDAEKLKSPFQTFESKTISAGAHSLDIAVLSDFQTYDPSFESKANVVIKSATIENTIEGGASECLPCPKGLVNTGGKSYCEPCPPGH